MLRSRFLAALAALVAFAGIDLAVSTASAAWELRNGACALLGAADAAGQMDVTRVKDQLGEALGAGLSAREALRSPGMRLLRATPVAGDVDALEVLATTVSKTALASADAIGALGTEDDPVETFYRDGAVDLPALARLESGISRAERTMADVADSLGIASRPSIGPLRRALAVARRRAGDALAGLRTSRDVLAAVPGLLGAEAPKRYFLAFQSPSEARGGGGLVGVYGILRADAGALEIETIDPIRKLVPKLTRPVDGPRWFGRAYADLLGLSEWREANLTPVFPVSSEVLLEMYEASTGERLDGVIALDPYVLAQIVRGTGPIRTFGLERKLTHRNVERTLLHDIYVLYQGREMAQNAYLKRLVASVQRKLIQGKFDPARLARGLRKAIAGQHLKVYVRDPVGQNAIRALDLDGDPRRRSQDLQMVFTNNFAANKVDYFLHRSISTQIRVEPSGDALVAVSVTLDNRSPAQGDNVLTRSGIRRDLPAGLNQMVIHALAPRDAVFTGIYVDGRRADPTIAREGSNPAASQVIEMRAGREAVVDFLYRWPGAAAGGRLDLTLFPQATVNPDRFDLEIVPPAGKHVVGPPGSEGRGDGSVAVAGTLDRARALGFVLAPEDAPGRARPRSGSTVPC